MNQQPKVMPLIFKEVIQIFFWACLCVGGFLQINALQQDIHHRQRVAERNKLLMQVYHAYGDGPDMKRLQEPKCSVEEMNAMAQEHGVSMTLKTSRHFMLKSDSDLAIFEFWTDVQECFPHQLSTQFFSVSRVSDGIQGKVVVNDWE